MEGNTHDRYQHPGWAMRAAPTPIDRVLACDMTDDALAALIVMTARDLDAGGRPEAVTASEMFESLGIVQNCHDGRGGEMGGAAGRRLRMEWCAGQLVELVKREKWFALNSWLNTAEKFTSVEGR